MLYTIGSISLFVLLILLGACSQETANNTAVVQQKTACSLLSAADVQAIQGEPVSEIRSTERPATSLSSSQCFYRLPTFNRSVSLELMQPAAGSSKGTEEFWERRFGEGSSEEEEERAAEREKEKERGGGTQAGTEPEAPAKPQAVSDVGDQAFWSGSQINGSLYLRKGDAILRISIGGPDDQAAKIDKARSLALRALNNL